VPGNLLFAAVFLFFASKNSLFLQKFSPYSGKEFFLLTSEFFRDCDRHFII